jgi:hypothetical protein
MGGRIGYTIKKIGVVTPRRCEESQDASLDIPCKIGVVTPGGTICASTGQLDIPCKIGVVTPDGKN